MKLKELMFTGGAQPRWTFLFCEEEAYLAPGTRLWNGT